MKTQVFFISSILCLGFSTFAGAQGYNYVEEVTEGNQQFSLELFKNVSSKEPKKNLMVSPFSISSALALTYEGASGVTLDEMAKVLHFPGKSFTREAFKVLNETLVSSASSSDTTKQHIFKIANRVWGQKGLAFEQEFLTNLDEYYGADLAQLDFALKAEESRLTINDWVYRQTEQKISDLIPKGAISSDTIMVLTNAVYFLAKWESPFNGHYTGKEKFFSDSKTSSDVDMMNKSFYTHAFHSDELKANLVRLNYQATTYSKSASMIVMVPDEVEGLAQLESRLDSNLLRDAFSNLSLEDNYQNIRFAMPKFKFEAAFELSDALMDLGMKSAFQDADFSAMIKNESLAISQVLHKTFINVDESGTEAAGATAVVIGRTSMPPMPTMEVRADRPFMFFIIDNAQNNVLFMGKVVNP